MRSPPWVGVLLALTATGCQSQVVNSLELRPPVVDAGPPIDASPCIGGGSALSFDGIGARVVADLAGSLPTGNSARTVEMWAYVRPTSWAINRYTLFEYGVNTLHQAFAIDMEPFPNMQVYSWDDDIFFDTGLTMQEGWLHVAATYDGKIMRAFINGNERGSKTPTDVLATVQTQVRIAWSPFTNAHFDGILDEVRIWNIARTAQEIKSTMSVRLTGDEAWLVAYWRFDEGAGLIAHDSSTRGNDATLELGPQWVPSGIYLGCPPPPP
jgi:hypothetical protein